MKERQVKNAVIEQPEYIFARGRRNVNGRVALLASIAMTTLLAGCGQNESKVREDKEVEVIAVEALNIVQCVSKALGNYPQLDKGQNRVIRMFVAPGLPSTMNLYTTMSESGAPVSVMVNEMDIGATDTSSFITSSRLNNPGSNDASWTVQLDQPLKDSWHRTSQMQAPAESMKYDSLSEVSKARIILGKIRQGIRMLNALGPDGVKKIDCGM